MVKLVSISRNYEIRCFDEKIRCEISEVFGISSPSLYIQLIKGKFKRGRQNVYNLELVVKKINDIVINDR